MEWVRNALGLLAQELVQAEADAIEARTRYESAKDAKDEAEELVASLETARDALRTLLDPSQRKLPL